MTKVILLKGLPASGKSTWAKAQKGFKRVNKDDLRAMIDNGEWSRENEKLIIRVRNEIIEEALLREKSIIVDDTNFNPSHEAQAKQIAENYHVEFEVKFFDVPVEECIERDSKRPAPVGEKVIRDMYEKYLQNTPKPYIPNQNLPKAIIVDIDGTLAKIGDRSPYDWQRVDEDTLNKPVADVVHALTREGEYGTLCVSGRDESCREKTDKWLTDNGVLYEELFMRPAGNTEKDSIIKERIFEEKIRDQYCVEFVIDDRDQVVKMWREKGLTCFQCADGNF